MFTAQDDTQSNKSSVAAGGVLTHKSNNINTYIFLSNNTQLKLVGVSWGPW